MGRLAILPALSFSAIVMFAGPAAAQEQETPADEVEETTREAEAPATDVDEEADEEQLEEPMSESDIRARELYVEGDRHYAEGRYEEAVEAFRQSYELSSRPLLLFNLANAYERMGRPAEAADALSRYLEHAEEGERPTLMRRIDALRARAERQQAPDPPPPPPPAPVEPPDDTLAWVLVASGGTVAASAIVLGALSLAASGEARESCNEDGDSLVCTGDARSALDRANALGVAADFTAGIGLATLAVGVVLLIVNHTGRRDADARVTASRNGVGMWVSF